MERALRLATILASLLGLAGCGDGEGGEPGSGTKLYKTAEDLMAAAPPEWRPAGESTATGPVSFLRPQGWEATVYTDGVAVRSAQASNGTQCEIFVLASRPAATGEEAKYQQLLQAVRSLFPEGTQLQDPYGGPEPLRQRWRGVTGRGWGYVGLVLSVDQTIDVLPLLADFGGTAVPVVVIQPRSSPWGCINSLGDFGVAPAGVFHSLSLAGFTPATADALASGVIGQWFSTSGGVGTLYVFGANGRYIDSGVHGGTVELSPGDWTSVYATWSGTGAYAVRGDVLGLFPSSGGARSRFIRHSEWLNGQGQWTRRLCWIASYEAQPYTHCLDESDT
jgi:hypothetical protein